MRIKIDISQNSNTVWFASDYHFFHKNIIKYDGRPFVKSNGDPDMDLMHKTLIKNWNACVGENDVVFYLGDLYFGHMDEMRSILHSMNGTIHYVLGNHDNARDIESLERFTRICDYIELSLDDADNKDLKFVLMHYPLSSWNKQKHGAYHIHGHEHMSHSNNELHRQNRIWDVGCNGWNYSPVNYKEILKLGKNINFKESKHH